MIRVKIVLGEDYVEIVILRNFGNFNLDNKIFYMLK